MATIPALVTSPGAVPSAPTGGVGGSQVRASPQMDIPAPTGPAGAQAAGAEMVAQADETTARSSAQLAQYGEQFADQYIKAKLNVDAANQIADQSAQLHEAEFQSSKIADRDKATADFDSRVGKIRDDYAATDVNPKVRAAVDASLPNQIALRRASTQQAAFGLESKAQVGSLITNIDQYNKQAVDAADPRLTEQIIGQANAAIDGRVAGGWLGADVAAKMKVDFGSNVYRTKIEIAMQKDMASGVALYNATKGKLNAADERAMGVMAADRTKQLDAETTVSSNMPRFDGGGGGGGGAVSTVHADAEKALGFALPVTSGDRTAEHNAEVGGATGSQHLTPGSAQDISLAGLTDEQKNKVYQQFLSDPRVGGIGFYADHLHIDTRGGQKATWGTPPAGVADQLKTWQSTPGAAQPTATGDQLAQARIAQLKYRQSVIDNLTLDPEIKARQLSIIDQRMSTTNAIVLEQRKSAADAADSAGQALYTGKYQTGTFQGISDQYRKAGDNSQADVYQYMADHEAQLIEDAKNPPAKESVAGHLLPGAAGKIAAQQSALARADIADARALSVQQRTENRRLGGEQEKIFNDGLNADVKPETLIANARDAYQYFRAAGDVAKAESIRQQLEGALEGSLKAKLPPAQAEKLKLEFQERANSPTGLSVKDAAVAKFLDKNESANRQRWDLKNGDPLQAAHDIGQIKLQPFDINMDPVNLQMWATQRASDAFKTTALVDPNTTNTRAPFFTQAEMSDISQKLEGMRPQEAQQFLAKLAVAVPQEVIPLIGQQMSKKDPVSDSLSAALGLYARGQPGDLDIANRIISGMNLWQKGGEDGKHRVGDEKLLQSTIDDTLVRARAGMNPDAIRLQNNAITADYIALTANKPDRTSIDTTALNQAITEVVGNTTTHNGASTIIPREIEPYQFRDGVAAISDSDVANLRPTAQGQPITAEVVRQKGQFVPVGDGKYQVWIPDPLRAGRTAPTIDGNTGKPWVVDIKPLIARGVTAPKPPPDIMGEPR